METTNQKVIYVLGFMFNKNKDRVAMIKKRHPDWMLNKLNGVGGVVQPDEKPADAMKREFEEEAGLSHDEWEHYATVKAPGWEMYCYRTFTNNVYMASSTTDEEILKIPVERIKDSELVENTTWLFEMALEARVRHASIELNLQI